MSFFPNSIVDTKSTMVLPQTAQSILQQEQNGKPQTSETSYWSINHCQSTRSMIPNEHSWKSYSRYPQKRKAN